MKNSVQLEVRTGSGSDCADMFGYIQVIIGGAGEEDWRLGGPGQVCLEEIQGIIIYINNHKMGVLAA